MCCFNTIHYAFFETYYMKYTTVSTYWSNNCFTDCIVHQMLNKLCKEHSYYPPSRERSGHRSRRRRQWKYGAGNVSRAGESVCFTFYVCEYTVSRGIMLCENNRFLKCCRKRWINLNTELIGRCEKVSGSLSCPLTRLKALMLCLLSDRDLIMCDLL